MKDELTDRIRALDPAPEHIVDREAADLRGLADRIATEGAGRFRRLGARTAAIAIAAAAAIAAVLIPLALLQPLGGSTPGAGSPTPTSGPTPTSTPSPTPILGPGGFIVVDLPGPGAEVTSPVEIGGNADVFEAVVSIQILDSDGNVLAETTTMATCGTGCRGTFEKRVRFTVSETQPGTIAVYEVSAKDGSEINVVRIPVTLVAT
jgi:hypothetical protein